MEKQPYLSLEVLQNYCDGALRNAAELAEEAALLCENARFARAYFLAIASIEETGKAAMAFDARGRDLTNKEVFDRLLQSFATHSEKITSAFVPWFAAHPHKVREMALPMADIMVALKNGREPSMYSEIRSDNHQIQLPSAVVRPKVAQDCVRLAVDCLETARSHVADRSPTKFTPVQDQLFALKPAKYQRTMKNPDFWWFFLAELESGRPDLAASVISYRERFELAGLKFRSDARDT
jgi:AbiV family abortive infection protein